MAQGIILAGGFSLRAKTNKMLLNIDNKPLIIHTIEGMRPHVNKIIVVTGCYDQEIRELLKNENVTICYNKDYERGMFSSVLTGVKAVTDDFFIIPGDIPFVKKETYQALLNGTKKVRYPVYKGKQGHPLFIQKTLTFSHCHRYNTNILRRHNKFPFFFNSSFSHTFCIDTCTICIYNYDTWF